MLFFGLFPAEGHADDDSHVSKKTSTQQVGGLLFDMDEGAKIEKGPMAAPIRPEELIREEIQEEESSKRRKPKGGIVRAVPHKASRCSRREKEARPCTPR